MNLSARSDQEPTQAPDLVDACLGDLVRTLADRPGVAAAERPAHAAAARKLVLSFRPQDTMQLMLSGHAVLFSALTADAARDVLAGAADAMKPRARSGAVAMGRIVAKHLDTLIRLQGRARAKTRAPEKNPSAPAAPEPVPVTEAPSVIADQAIPETREAGEIPAPAPAAEPTARVYPGREKMLHARAARGSRRARKLLAHKAITMLRAAARVPGSAPAT